MKKYMFGLFALILAIGTVAFTVKPAQPLSDFYYVQGTSWVGVSSISEAKSFTSCDELVTTECARVFSRSKLIMDGETVLGIATDENTGQPFAPDVILYELQ